MCLSTPVSGSRKEFPVIPVTAGGAAQAIAALLTLVTVGHRPSATSPFSANRVDRNGVAPLSR
jgi:hypothetical protein